MKNCIQFDRASCYFSFRALAKYSEGLYYLGKENKGTYRLLISENVSEETFSLIREGYMGHALLDDQIRRHMIDELSLQDEFNLSNLVFLMKCGIVEIKFAYCRGGLFHTKFGYIEDGAGNSLCFNGSNNETAESISSNYEKFDTTASWLCSDFDYEKIDEARREFEELWQGKSPFVIVFDPPESFDTYLDRFNRNKILENSEIIINETFYIDYDESLITIRVPKFIENPSSLKFRLRIPSLIDTIDNGIIKLEKDVSHRDIRRLIIKLKDYCVDQNTSISMSEGFLDFFNSGSPMEELADLGISIKNRDKSHNDYFQMFSRNVDSITERPLRLEQKWDSYFAYRLGKSANFSVPGSGKTSTVLGTFAYLYKTGVVKRLIVIGPLNSFDSWKTEFKLVFGDKISLSSIDTLSTRQESGSINYDIRFNSGNTNLILVNYESFDRNADLKNALISRLGNDSMLVFDEVHRVKNISGKRANAVLPIARNSKYTTVLTGTPIPNDYTDIYNFLHILYPLEYDDYFCFNPKDLSSPSKDDIEIINRRMQPFFCRTTKDKLGVPPANRDSIICVNASESENRLFYRMHSVDISPLVMIIRILQLASDPSLIKHKISALEISSFIDDSPDDEMEGMDGFDSQIITAKTLACVKLVTELVSSGKTVVLWCIFTRSIENLSKLLTKEGIEVCTVYGITDNKVDVINDFRNGRYKVLITNPQTLAESVSLHQISHDAVYFEYSYNLIHMLQSKDRIHRLGLADNQYTQYHFLQTIFNYDNKPISLDREIYSRLGHKEQVMLNAIENNSLERFTTTSQEVEEILSTIGILPKKTGNNPEQAL